MPNKTTADIIAQIESNDNPLALRYEKNWRYFSDDVTHICAALNLVSRDTARMILSTSWGKYQIMGQVLYELGFVGTIFTDFLLNEEAQERWFYSFLESRRINYSCDLLCEKEYRDRFARRYNGDTVKYGVLIATWLKNHGYDVK